MTSHAHKLLMKSRQIRERRIPYPCPPGSQAAAKLWVIPLLWGIRLAVNEGGLRKEVNEIKAVEETATPEPKWIYKDL